MLETSKDYQNTSAIVETCMLTKQNESKAANNYCQTHATEESKEEISDFDIWYTVMDVDQTLSLLSLLYSVATDQLWVLDFSTNHIVTMQM